MHLDTQKREASISTLKLIPSIEELAEKGPKVPVTENQLKVMANKYLRDDSVELWLRRIARNIALAELLYEQNIDINEVLKGVCHESLISDHDPKSSILLLQSKLPEQTNNIRWKNFLKFQENLLNLASKNQIASKILRNKEDQFFKMLSNFDFLPNSPCLMNAGRDLQMLHACFVLPVPDSMEGIMKAVTAQVMIHKSGGGTGMAFSNIRPEGDLVKSTKGVASGPMSFIRIFDTATDVIKQGSTRRGANMGILHYKHPDIKKFIISKSKDKGFLQNFNISVALDEEFIKAVESDGEFELINPKSKEVVGTERAKEIFDLMGKCAWETGDPGFVVIDRINNTTSNPTPKLGQIESTNPCGEQPLLAWEPCFAPDTIITTNKGLETIEELYHRQLNGEEIIIATDNKVIGKNGIEFRPAIVSKTGYKKIVEVRLNNWQSLKVTPNHKLFTKEGWKRADKLTHNDFIFIQDGSIYHNNIQLTNQNLSIQQQIFAANNEHQLYGWLSGDGWFVEGNRPCAGICFGPDEKFAQSKLIPLFRDVFRCNSNSYIAKDDVVQISTEKNIAIEKLRKLGFKPGKAPQKEVPKYIFTTKPDEIRSYLGGLFSADGEVSAFRRRVRLSSASLKLITQVQMLLLNFGIKSRISESKVDKRTWYELAINAKSYDKFADLIGFPLSPVKQELLMAKLNIKIRNRIDNTFSKVKSVEIVGFSEVYDITEPQTQSLIANGIIAHNCTLGSINLSNHINSIGGKNVVDYEKLENTTNIAVNFLDNVIDMSSYPLPEIELMSKGNRRIGLGVMGWAEMLVKLEIPYDSGEAITLAEEIMGFINTKALETSELLAEKRGVFYHFKDSIFDETGPHFKGKKIYPKNCARTTIAPTGTIAITAGLQGSGIEPFFAIAYKRYQAEAVDALKRGEEPPERYMYYEVIPIFFEVAEKYRWFGFDKNSLLKKIIENNGSVKGIKEIPEKIQRIFVSSHDLHWKTHIDHQAAFQRFTDNAVSKTINLPNSATVEDIQSAYMYAYKTGCKGVTVYRDGCKEVQVLSTGSTKKQKERDLSKGAYSDYYEIETGHGPLHINIAYDKEKGPFRIFTSMTPIGTELSNLTGVLGIFMSKAFQAGFAPEKAIKHLNSAKGDRPIGFGSNRIDSIPHAIAIALKRHLEKTGKIENKEQLKLTELEFTNKQQQHCHKCYSPNVEYINGCSTPTCLDCGHSECS